MKVAIFSTCIMDLLFPNVGQAMVAVLERFGCETVMPVKQICCGQPTYNSGYVKDTMRVMHNEVDALLGVDADYIVGPAGSCVAMLKEYPEHLAADADYAAKAAALAAKTYEFSQFVYRVLHVLDAGARLDGVATYHRSCHMTRLLGERTAPFELLKHVAGLTMVPLPKLENCCGFGGMFSVKEPLVSTMMVDEKVATVVATSATVLISCDQACLMNIGGRMNRLGHAITIMHLAEVLNHDVDMSRVRYIEPTALVSGGGNYADQNQ